MLSNTAEYALKATLFIANNQQPGPVQATTIAEFLGIPGNYLSKILHQLARAGVLTSTRGRAGGFNLSNEPSEISLAEIIRPFDNILRQGHTCMLSRSECDQSDPCPAHSRWVSVQDSVNDFFETTTVAQLAGTGV